MKKKIQCFINFIIMIDLPNQSFCKIKLIVVYQVNYIYFHIFFLYFNLLSLN